MSWTCVHAQEMGAGNTLTGICCLHSDHAPRPLGKGRELDCPRPARGGCCHLRYSDLQRDVSVSCLPPARYGVLWGRIHHRPREEHKGQHAEGRLDSLHLQGDPAGEPPCARLSLRLLLVVVAQSLSRVRLLAAPWATARQASCPLPAPRACSSSCPSGWRCHPTISPPVTPALPAALIFPIIGCHCTDDSFHDNQGFCIACWLRQLKPHHDVDSGLYLKKLDLK